MADETTPSSQGRDQLRQFREVVANAVGELRAQQQRDSFSSLSLEELMDQHVELLVGTSDTTRPSRLQRVQKIKADLDNNIEAMKATDPDLFRAHDPDSDVNTAPDSEDQG